MIRISFFYPKAVVELAKRVPYHTDQVMGVFKDHNRNIKHTEKVLRHHEKTGEYIKPENIDKIK